MNEGNYTPFTAKKNKAALVGLRKLDEARGVRQPFDPAKYDAAADSSDIFDPDAERAEKIEAREEQRDAQPPVNGASEKQIKFITDLLAQKEIDADAADAIRAQIAAGKVDRDRASRYLDKLIALPKKQAATETREELPVGMYRSTAGTIFRVYLGQKSGRNLVKRLVSQGDVHEYEYVGAATSFAAKGLVEGAEQLSMDEAKAFGRMTGHCCVCARRLDDPESVEAGIGPVCAKKF